MKLVYAGTPAFAAVALEALVDAGHDTRLVLTQPDRPAGRGLKLVPSAVKRAALGRGLPVAQPATLRDAAITAQLRALDPDVMVVAAYGLILPSAVLAIPRLGCLNIHASLLPRWRGAAPIQRAILAGDAASGITIMQMDAGLDTGPMVLQEAVPIAPDETAQTLHDKLAVLGGRLIVRALANTLVAVPQDAAAATYAAKIDKREAVVDWQDDATAIERKVRAFDPVPGASTSYGGETLKIWRAVAEAGATGEPGMVQEAGARGIVVGCGQGMLRITELQRSGGKRLPAAVFLSGADLAAGVRLGG